MSDLVREFLSKRGITAEEEIDRFLNPDYERDTHSPAFLEGIDRAVARIFTAIAQDEQIAIYADFDCDGIPGAAVLWDFFHKINYKNVEVYLPHRDREGYGFHPEAIEQLVGGGVSLIITVDVGTTAVEPVAHAKNLGVDIIVTDHHEIIGALPDALAVINPKLGEYPFRDLCGAGVAFKLVQALLIEGKKRELERFTEIPEGWEKWLLDLVAIATIADMVPLVGENRALVHFGLKVLRKSPRPGILALVNRLRLRRAELTEDDVAFSIAPRINAASRMDEPDSAFRLLTCTDTHEAQMIAAHLEELNTQRKGVVSGVVRQAKKNVRQRFGKEDRVIVLGNPDWKPAILGLAANSIMADRGGVVCLWGRDANGNLKGSCRSDGSVSLIDLFSNAGDVFENSGGHAKSGGFSVSHKNVHALPEALAAAVAKIEQSPQGEEVKTHDALITLSEVSVSLYSQVSQLAPFGIGNPKPVFRVSKVCVAQVRRFGKSSAHVELSLECRKSGARSRAFDFYRAPEGFSRTPVQGEEAQVLATIERDSFRGGLVLRLIDVLA